MGKIRREDLCYQSPTGSRPPKCRQPSASLCGACRDAMVHYNQVSAVIHETRRRKNCEYARVSRMRREDKFSDLMAENMALTLEYEGLVSELGEVNNANKAVSEAIDVKVQEILAHFTLAHFTL